MKNKNEENDEEKSLLDLLNMKLKLRFWHLILIFIGGIALGVLLA